MLDAHHRLHVILLLVSFNSVEFTSHLFTELYSSYLTVPTATQFLASGLLWFDASWLGMWFLTFWRNVLASFSEVKRPFRMPVRVKQWGCIDRSDHWWLYEADGKLIGRPGGTCRWGHEKGRSWMWSGGLMNNLPSEWHTVIPEDWNPQFHLTFYIITPTSFR